jgi:flagellar hook-associated protein 3 FlgL
MRVDPSYITNLVGSLDQAQSNEQQLSSELSSGVSITSLEPESRGRGQNVLLLNQIQQDDSFTQSSSLVTGQLQVADSALGSVVSELTQAVTLATSANNGTMNASDVKSIGNPDWGHSQRGAVAGEHQLSGPVHFWRRANRHGAVLDVDCLFARVTTYSGDEDVNYLGCRTGRRSSSMFPAIRFFLAAARAAFLARSTRWSPTIHRHSEHFAGGQRHGSLGTALNYVSQQRVTIDNSITQLSAASGAVTSEQTQLTTAQTDLMQADIPTISTQLSLAETQQTALEDVIAQLEFVCTLRTACSASCGRK